MVTPDLTKMARKTQAALTWKASSAPAKAGAPLRSFPQAVGPTEALVDVAALAGNALVLSNGNFVRMFEVAPVDLEQGNAALKQDYWVMFGNALRRLRAPLSLQIVITSQLQDLSAYLAQWDTWAREWQARAEVASDPKAAAQCTLMGQRARETAAFLSATQQKLMPMQQRYLVAIPFNPFVEAATRKKQARLLDDATMASALEKLDEIVASVRAALGEIGLPLYDLDPAAMCRVLWEHAHHPVSLTAGAAGAETLAEAGRPLCGQTGSSPCPTPEEFYAAAQDPGRLAALIAPEVVEEVENGAYVRVGEALARGYEVYDFDPRTPVDFASLLGFSTDVSYALYLDPADPVTVRQLYKDRETDLRASTITDARRGALTDHGRQAAIASVEEARAEMETALQAPYFLRWYAVLWAGDAATLDKKSTQLETQFKLRDLRYRRATRRHLSVVQSVRPVARPVYKLTPRNMSADSLGPFFPFIRCDHMDPGGWHFGLHRGNSQFICLDTFEGGRSNASELILGAPRSGKSVYLKQQIETLLAQGDIVWYVDPEREGLALAVDHHAPYLELGFQGKPANLPVLDPGDPNSFRDGLVALAATYETRAGVALTPVGQDTLLHAYVDTLAAAGILYEQSETWCRPTPPLTALLQALQARAVSPADEAAEIARVLAYTNALLGGNKVNIMELDGNADNPWIGAVENLAAFVECIMRLRLSPDESNALREAYQTTMRKWGFGPHQHPDHPAPPLSELFNTLVATGDLHAHHLASALKPFTDSDFYGGMFDCTTNVDVAAEPFVVFGLRSLRENAESNLAAVFVWQILQLAWKQIVANSGTGRRFHLFIDEAWYLLEQPGAALRLEHMVRSLPKYSAALHLATHDALKLAGSAEAQIIRDMTRVKVLFKQESEAAARSLGVFGLTDGEQASLMRLGKGEAWLLIGHDLHLPLYVAVNPLRLFRLSSNSEQMQSVAVARRAPTRRK